MRITNKIMQNNSLANINLNKILQDKLNTQITTQSKIVRPSDDPVVAIRALRLRTNLSDITQYYERNIPDATSWMSVTEEALKTMTKVVTDMYANCEKGAKGSLKAEDRLKILEDLKGLREEVYATGDADYAGRSIFTGYRTNVRLSFQNDTKIPYKITEQLNKDIIDSIKYVDIDDLQNITGTNFGPPNTASTETVSEATIHRIRLSYDKMDGTIPEIKLKKVDADGNVTYEPLQVNGNDADIVSVSKNATPNPYELARDPANKEKIYFIPETGELLLGADAYKEMNALSKNQEIAVSYEKTGWKEGDLRPEHYFACTATEGPDPDDVINYNPEFLTRNSDTDIVKQVISYDVGFNQDIRVNTLANECFTHNIGRDVDELVAVTQEAVEMEKIVNDLDAMYKSENYTEAEKEQIKIHLDAANKAYTLINDKCQKMFENGMTKMQGHLDQTSVALTNVGSRTSRLAMVENRLKAQQTNFMELTENNEGIDITKAAIELKSAELAYEAALMATGKIVQNSLMNFI